MAHPDTLSAAVALIMLFITGLLAFGVYSERLEFPIEVRPLHANPFRKFADTATDILQLMFEIGLFKLLARLT